MQQIDLEALLVTRGSDGMTLIENQAPALHLRALAKEVFDVTGAGDTVISVLSAAVAAGSSLFEATRLANYAAGIVVGKLGAASVTVSELRRAIHTETSNYTGVVSENALQIYIQDAKAHGEKIVFTNGCFDILHAGHVRYLKQAKELGDRLIIAVNDDSSVKKLKGSNRR